ncbi:unnamed protein product [Camellia sinensis]
MEKEGEIPSQISQPNTASGSQTLVSQGSIYELGFFGPGNSLNIFLGIWFKNFAERIIVWVANRDKPLSDPSSLKLGLSEDGNLVLLDSLSKTLIWTTNLVSPPISNSTEAVLLDDGNFILRNGSEPSTIYWQSFDHPTDTWMPGAKLGINKLTGKTQLLTSWKNSEDPAPGRFSLQVDPNGSSQFFIVWNMSRIYWTSGVWNGQRFSLVPEMGVDYAATMVSFHFHLMRRTQRLNDWSGGCARKTRLQCESNISNTKNDGFRKISILKLPPANSKAYPARNGKQCESACSLNCSCIAYAYNGSGCSIWDRALLNLQLSDGTNTTQNLYIKLAASELLDVGGEQKKGVGDHSDSGSPCYACYRLLPLAFMEGKAQTKCAKYPSEDLLVFDFDGSSNATDHETNAGYNLTRGKKNDADLPFFSFASVSAATDGFSSSNKLGQGGFGPVYKDPSKREMPEWRTRIHIIEGIAQGLLYLHQYSRLRIIHRNLKASNILLDDAMNPKISGFGMARIFGEYAMDGIFSIKSDVFSFGVLLLEIAWDLWNADCGLDLLDPVVNCPSSLMLLGYINIGLLCVQENPADRPTMSYVVSMLNNELALLPKPKQPAFSTSRTVVDTNPLLCSEENCSLNGVTMSLIQARYKVDQITRAFYQENLKLLDPKTLSNLQSHHVEPIIFHLRSKPSSAIRLFEWSENFQGFNHTLESFCCLSHVLLSQRLLDPAKQVFDRMVGKFGDLDVVSVFCKGFKNYGSNPSTVYSFLVENYCRIGMVDRSFEVFIRMSEMGIPLSTYALSTMLSSLVDSQRIDYILDVYGKMGNGQREEQSRCLNVYDFVINGFFMKGEVEMGLNFHQAMIERGFMLDIVACDKILKRLCKGNCIGVASKYFSLIAKIGPNPSLVTFSTLINGYCKELRLEEAFDLYNLMTRMGIAPDLIIYSILIDGLFRVGKLDEGLCLLSAALDRGMKLDVVVFSSVINAYVRIGDLEKGIEIYNRMLKEGITPSIVTYSILINGLCQKGWLLEACGIFGEIIKQGFEPSVLTYSSLIDGFCKCGKLKDGFDLYEDMVKKGHTPDVIVYCVFITALSKQGWMVDALILKQLKDAVKLYIHMGLYNIIPDVVTYTVLIKGIAEKGRPGEALILFFQILKRGFSPNVVTYCAPIDGFCNQKNSVAGLQIFQLMPNNGVNPDITIYNVLINMFFREGRLKNALELFWKVHKCGPEPDIVTYNTMICGYCSLKMLSGAVQLYEELKHGWIKPNAKTFTVLIDAFCKEGRMDDAMMLFSTMLEKGPEPNVVTYSCLTDGYFKSYNMKNAFELHKEMSRNKIPPNIVSYSILIDGLCKRGLVEEASLAFCCAVNQHLLPDVMAYSILIRHYCKVGRLADAMMLYNHMLEDGIMPDSLLRGALAEYHLQNGQGG